MMNSESNSDGKKPTSGPKVGMAVAAVVGGMILIQIAQKEFQLTTKAQAPGVGRGDVAVTDECLPETIGIWKKIKFEPAPETPPEGQFWWSHMWIFASDNAHSRVSFDQADWMGWHELSECYSAAGWTLNSREIRDAPDSEWQYVLSKFTRSPNHHAAVVFSLFFEDGAHVVPWQLSLAEAVKENMTTMQKLMDRRRHASDRSDARSLQMQVTVSGQGAISDDVISAAIELHLETRGFIRDECLRVLTERIELKQ